MEEEKEKRSGWKQRLFRETIEYSTTFIYLAFFFGAFAWYRRLILAEYQISYLNYGVALIEALVLAKVVLVGNVFGLGRGLENKPLILPALYKAFVFTIWMAAFEVVGSTAGSLLRGKGLGGGVHELVSKGKYELLAKCLVTFFVFIPFFAFRELERVLGRNRIRMLFFRRRAAGESGPDAGSQEMA